MRAECLSVLISGRRYGDGVCKDTTNMKLHGNQAPWQRP